MIYRKGENHTISFTFFCCLCYIHSFYGSTLDTQQLYSEHFPLTKIENARNFDLGMFELLQQFSTYGLTNCEFIFLVR